MPNLTIVYWRDIPAQVLVGKGRRAAKAPLPERFEQAIDRCAMKVGARDDDAYMAGFRKVDEGVVGTDPADAAAAAARKIDEDYGQDRLKDLIANEGWATSPAQAE